MPVHAAGPPPPSRPHLGAMETRQPLHRRHPPSSLPYRKVRGGCTALLVQPGKRASLAQPSHCAAGRCRSLAAAKSAACRPALPTVPIYPPSPPPAGVDPDAVVQQLTGRGPCSQVFACFVAPCSLPGACPGRQVCLNDYCGGCNAACADRAAVCQAVLRIQPGAVCS